MAKVMLVQTDPWMARRLTKVFDSVQVPSEVVSDWESALDKIQKDPPVVVVAEKPQNPETLATLNAVMHSRAPATGLIVTLSQFKVEAAMEFVQLTGKRAVITSVQAIQAAVEEKAGTEVITA